MGPYLKRPRASGPQKRVQYFGQLHEYKPKERTIGRVLVPDVGAAGWVHLGVTNVAVADLDGDANHALTITAARDIRKGDMLKIPSPWLNVSLCSFFFFLREAKWSQNLDTHCNIRGSQTPSLQIKISFIVK